MSARRSPVWPPGFVPQLVFETADQKKAKAARRAREARAKEGVKAWGTNTQEKKGEKL